jgi:cell wall-associated NlpC family hydrolase
MEHRAFRLCALCALAAVPWIFHRGSGMSGPVREVDFNHAELQPGDVILRRGRDAVSGIVLASDQGSRFSHAGIVIQAGRLLGVVHVLPAEPAHPKGTVMAEPVEIFSSPDEASEVAIFRLLGPRSGVPAEAARIALRYVKEQRRFDYRFDLATPSELYCSELVWRAFREAGTDLVDGRFRKLALPIRSGDFVLPSSLANSLHLEMILDSKTEK